MSNQNDNLDNQNKAVDNSTLSTQKKAVVVSQESVVEVAKKRSPKDIVLWLLAILALITSTLVSEVLPKYWAALTDVWTQVGVTVGLVVFAFFCLAFTHQGSAFKTLLKDAGTELRRITWPSKEETTTYTWQVIVVIIIVGIMIWLLDIFFNKAVGYVLG